MSDACLWRQSNSLDVSRHGCYSIRSERVSRRRILGRSRHGMFRVYWVKRVVLIVVLAVLWCSWVPVRVDRVAVNLHHSTTWRVWLILRSSRATISSDRIWWTLSLVFFPSLLLVKVKGAMPTVTLMCMHATRRRCRRSKASIRVKGMASAEMVYFRGSIAVHDRARGGMTPTGSLVYGHIPVGLNPTWRWLVPIPTGEIQRIQTWDKNYFKSRIQSNIKILFLLLHIITLFSADSNSSL